jgi:hypothetical protein
MAAGTLLVSWLESTNGPCKRVTKVNTNLSVEPEPDGRLRLSGPCAVTGKKYSVVVPLEGAIAYFARGAHIAEAFPELQREEREFLISGTSPEGWTRLFGGIKRRRTSHTEDKGRKITA